MIKENYTLLKKIEKRTPMWTGDYTLKSISSYLNGYVHALSENKIIEKDGFGTEPFHDWVAAYLGFNESTAGWAHMILASSLGLKPNHIQWKNVDQIISKEQHHQSIRKFYELLDLYIKEDK